MSRQLDTWVTLFCLATFASGCGAADSLATDSGKVEKEKPAAVEKERQPSRITSSVDVQPAAKRMTAAESREVSFAAGRILKHVAQAREAIQTKKTDDARHHVDQGLKLIDIINTVVPHYTVKTEIKAGELVYEDDDDVAPQWVTVFDELEHRDVITPVSTAKNEAEQKKTTDSAPKGNGVKNAGLVVAHADVEYSALKLNVHLADRLLHSAKKALTENETEPADLALLTIQASGVVLEYDEIDLPLEEAADNLKIAEADMKSGNHEGAKAALLLAMDELEAYEQLAGPSRSKEVKAMHEEMNKLALKLTAEEISPEDRKKLASEISTWWDKLSDWFKKKN